MFENRITKHSIILIETTQNSQFHFLQIQNPTPQGYETQNRTEQNNTELHLQGLECTRPLKRTNNVKEKPPFSSGKNHDKLIT